jgi:HlyD family secretion protein
MDVARQGVARRKMIRRIIIGAVVLTAIPLITVGLSRLKPAAPTVERAVIWPGTVKRGEMLRQVRGLGTLVPEDILAIPATTDGRVTRKLLLPGVPVKADTIIIELSNPVLQADLVDAEWKVRAAEASYTNLKVQLSNQLLDQQASLESILSQYNSAKLEADRDKALYEDGLKVELLMKQSKNRADDLWNRYLTDKKRVEAVPEMIKAQLAVQETTVEQSRAMYQLKKSQVEALKVRAGTEGVLKEVNAEEGQRITAGTTLAKVVQPWRLKAELKIPETQAKDVTIGQPVQVDTRNGIINGRVSRIDPAAINGTVTVDAKLLDELPKGARPDLSIEGTIELERLKDVLYVERPVFGQEQSSVTVFKIEPDGRFANRTRVKFGRSSVSTIEILGGLQVGDQIILSDMSAQDNYDRIQLN